MSRLLLITRLVLAAALAFSLWGTWLLMYTNGFVRLMQDLRDNGPHLLPGTNAPLRRSYTGVAPIDYQLTVLCIFFWSIIDGSHPEYSLHITDFCFQFAVQYAVCVIEGSRPGNNGQWFSYVAIWGAIMQNFGVTNTLPVFALIYLAFSPAIKSPKPSTILPSTKVLISLPLSIILGYFVPVGLMRAPFISIDGQQIWLAVWQAFPLWIAILQQAIPVLIGGLLQKGKPADDFRENVQALRSVYSFLRYLSVFGHLISWGVAIKAMEAPHLFANSVSENLNPATIWLPISFSTEYQVPSIGSGAHLFLQYDRIGSSIALLVFAYYINARNRALSPVGHLLTIAKALLAAILMGPAGAAIGLLEARDDSIFDQHGAGLKKVM